MNEEIDQQWQNISAALYSLSVIFLLPNNSISGWSSEHQLCFLPS